MSCNICGENDKPMKVLSPFNGLEYCATCWHRHCEPIAAKSRVAMSYRNRIEVAVEIIKALAPKEKLADRERDIYEKSLAIVNADYEHGVRALQPDSTTLRDRFGNEQL
jgi:hypothetical protein